LCFLNTNNLLKIKDTPKYGKSKIKKIIIWVWIIYDIIILDLAAN